MIVGKILFYMNFENAIVDVKYTGESHFAAKIRV